jgi:sporulation protein YlmC with PRC-barrel domain
MIRASKLKGIGLVDIDRAEKIGEVGEVFIDPEARQVAGFGVRRGQSFLGGDEMLLLPASAVRAIGPDAITVGGASVGASEPRLAAMPRLSQIVGRRVVTTGGRALGPIGDVLVEPETGRIAGYALETGVGGGLRSLFAGPGDEPDEYIRADANLRVGRDLVVAPDESLVSRRGAGDGVSLESLLEDPGRSAYSPGQPVAWNDEAWGRGPSAWIEPIEPAATQPIAPVHPAEELESTERIRVVRAPQT